MPVSLAVSFGGTLLWHLWLLAALSAALARGHAHSCGVIGQLGMPCTLLRVLLPLTCAGTHTARAVVTVGNQQAVRRSMAYSGVLPRKTSVDRKNAGT